MMRTCDESVEQASRAAADCSPGHARLSAIELRGAFAQFPTGVTVVTALAQDDQRIGLTVSSFNTVSLDPPLVLVSLARTYRSLADLVQAQAFAIHVLSESQMDLATRFASKAVDKWARVSCHTGQLGAPMLPEALGVFECRPWASYDGGDHIILVGRVIHAWRNSFALPLVFFRSAFCGVRSHTSTMTS